MDNKLTLLCYFCSWTQDLDSEAEKATNWTAVYFYLVPEGAGDLG